MYQPPVSLEEMSRGIDRPMMYKICMRLVAYLNYDSEEKNV